MNLDFSFYNWELIRAFILKGFYFSVLLTVAATAGGVLFGILLAMMRLSGRKWLEYPATFYVNGMRSIPLVMVILWFYLLVPRAFYTAIPWGLGENYRSEISAVITFVAFEAAYFSEIMLDRLRKNRCKLQRHTQTFRCTIFFLKQTWREARPR